MSTKARLWFWGASLLLGAPLAMASSEDLSPSTMVLAVAYMTFLIAMPLYAVVWLTSAGIRATRRRVGGSDRDGERRDWATARLRSLCEPGERLLAVIAGPVVSAANVGAEEAGLQAAMGVTDHRVRWLEFEGGIAFALTLQGHGSTSVRDVTGVSQAGGHRETSVVVALADGSRRVVRDRDPARVAEFVRSLEAQRQVIHSTGGVASELEALSRLHEAGVLNADDWALARTRFLGAPVSAQDLAAKTLSQLHDLHRQGVLSESEFNMKKWEILSRP